ncbi:MAG: response regulator transcription factor [Eubacteriaceae bacterium]|nr:response regulator transcription factor [Eubacteriaceae bacterium]
MNKKILIVEDEIKIVEVVESYLNREGYITLSVYDGAKAISAFKSFQPDMIILDLMLPNLSGEEISREIRTISKVPIIMLTSKSDEESILGGFEFGADDYVLKPFSPKQLVARVEAVLRRTEPPNSINNRSSDKKSQLEINHGSRSVAVRGKEIDLTKSEYNILELLSDNPGRVYSREDIIMKVFGEDYEGFDRTIDSHIKNLRSKIEDDPQKPAYIKTVFGVGYKFGGERK